MFCCCLAAENILLAINLLENYLSQLFSICDHQFLVYFGSVLLQNIDDIIINTLSKDQIKRRKKNIGREYDTQDFKYIVWQVPLHTSKQAN